MQSPPELTAKELLLWLLRRRKRYKITGDSMRPALLPGDDVLADLRAYRHTPPQPGDIVIARHPFQSDVTLIKRVTQTLPNAHYDLRGDNPAASTDSRTLGLIPQARIIARVTCKF